MLKSYNELGRLTVCTESNKVFETGWHLDHKHKLRGMTVEKIGDEFQINTTTESFQLQANVTGLAEGGFAAAWTDFSSTREDPSYTVRGEIRSQAYNADDTARGDEFLVNTTTEVRQEKPRVAGLSDGGFGATWENRSQTGEDTSGRGAIRGQVYDADGTARREELLIACLNAVSQYLGSDNTKFRCRVSFI